MATSTELKVRVIPNASRDVIVGWHAGALKIKTAVAPESGKANKAICALLAKHLGLPKRAVTVLRGQTSQMKCMQMDPHRSGTQSPPKLSGSLSMAQANRVQGSDTGNPFRP